MFFCSNIDEVVLNYVASVLESLGEEDSSFDVDQFIDMISAYVPGFSDISRSTSVVWKNLQCKIYIYIIPTVREVVTKQHSCL